MSPITATRRSLSARLGPLTVALGLVGCLITVSPSSGPVSAVEHTVSGPAAALSSGLRRAERLSPPTPAGPQISADVRAILDSVNAARATYAVPPVALHAQLTEAALAHAADQFNKNCLTTLTHTGTDGSNPGVRIARTGLSVSTWGENIACNQQSSGQVMQAWMNSAGHRANILNPNFTHIGISVTRDSSGHLYWMQVFGTPR